MPRVSSSFKSSSSSSSSRPRNHTTISSKSSPATSVAPYHPPPVPAVFHPTAPTFFQSAKEGFGLGVGASIARNIVDRAFGSVTSVASVAPVVSSQPPKHEMNTKLYEQCIQNGATEEFCRQISAADNEKSEPATK